MFDTHFHIFDAHLGIVGARYVPSYSATLSTWQATATLVGVTQGVLVQPSFLGTDNRLLLEALSQHAASLRGIVVVAPSIDGSELCRMDALGVRGIRLNLAGHSHDISAWSTAKPLWDSMLQLGWHVEVHTDQGALPQVLAQLPQGIPITLDHMGKPRTASKADESIAALIARSKQSAVHVKLSGAYRLGGISPRDIAQIWLGELGVDQLLWGSDWPCTNHESEANYPALLHQLEDWIGAHNLHSVLTTNPLTLYR